LTQKTQTVIHSAILAIALSFTSTAAVAQRSQHFGHKQLRLLISSAADADDYQKLAEYFHYNELLFREKAQRVANEYANHAGKYPMATKSMTRAEVMSRFYDRYSFKSGENARLAKQYDKKLLELGIKLESESAMTISIKSLQHAFTGMRGWAFIERYPPAGSQPFSK
jgi:hypothetical protein